MKDIFYKKNNTEKERKYYIRLLNMMGSLTNLFADGSNIYINSRVTENLFCRCLNADNLSRSDITADAKKNNIGIGIKTWIGSNHQKIAEFDRQKPEYDKLKLEDKIYKIAEFRNDRIDFTMRSQNLKDMIYHCICREYNKIIIKECKLEKININKIKKISQEKNTIFFQDDLNRYSFQTSKSTLYKYFDDLVDVDSTIVEIISDPYYTLEKLLCKKDEIEEYVEDVEVGRIYLPLYSIKYGEKIVYEKSGLNQRFANGRRRNEYEVYIPISAECREKIGDFFPERDKSFDLKLPNDKIISAKICQDDGKALMSNPNVDLGHWLIDDVFKINSNELITYEMLEKYGIDSVIIQKMKNIKDEKVYYLINFAKIGSYEEFMGIE